MNEADFEAAVKRILSAYGDSGLTLAPPEVVAEQAMSRSPSRAAALPRAALLLAALAAGAVLVIVSVIMRSPPNLGSPNVGTNPDAAGFASMLDKAIARDYELADNPGTLARWADVVVLGTLEAAVDGSTIQLAPGRSVHTLHVTVRVTDVLKGAPDVKEGSIVLELMRAPDLSVEDYTRVMPVGDRVLVFAYDHAPTGAQPRVFSPSPQGFWIEDGENLISVFDPEVPASLPGWKGLSTISEIVSRTDMTAP